MFYLFVKNNHFFKTNKSLARIHQEKNIDNDER